MDQLASALQLHEQIVAGLKSREQTIQEREDEARRALEQALASCAEERASIGREKALLLAVEELYTRHANQALGVATQTGSSQPMPESPPPLPSTVKRAISEPNEPMALVATDTADQVAATIRNLRQGLISEMRGAKERV